MRKSCLVLEVAEIRRVVFLVEAVRNDDELKVSRYLSKASLIFLKRSR